MTPQHERARGAAHLDERPTRAHFSCVVHIQDAARALTAGEREPGRRGERESLGGSRWLPELGAESTRAPLLSSPGSRSRCLGVRSRQRAACPRFIWAARPGGRQLSCRVNVSSLPPPPLSRATAPLLWLTPTSAPAKMEREGGEKAGEKVRNVKNGERGRCFRVCPSVRVVSRPRSSSVLRFSVTGTPRFAGGKKTDVRPCVFRHCDSSSASRAPQSPLSLSNVPDCQTHPGTRSWPHSTPLEPWEL